MKALVVTPYYYPKIGGLENYARQLNHALSGQQQWDIVIVTSTNGWKRHVEAVDGHRTYRLGTWFKLSNTPFNPLWPFMIRAIIKREKPAIILAHAPVPSLADAAALAKGSTPFVLVYHAATLLKAGSPLFNMAARMYSLFGAATFRRADRIFAVSGFVRDRLSPALQAKTVVVPNSVWATDIKVRPQPQKPHFVFIASLERSHAWKGLEHVLEAVAVYRDRYGKSIRLTVIGDGNMRAAYERSAQRLGITKQVRFSGRQVGAGMLRLTGQAMGMIVYPTTENDAFPTVMLEAWAQHVPVVAAHIGALASLVTHGTDGLVCAPKQPAALAEAMHELAAMSETARGRIARTAASRTAKNYTWERQAAFVNRLARSLV